MYALLWTGYFTLKKEQAEMAEMPFIVAPAGYRILDHTSNGDISENLGRIDSSTVMNVS
jgi:hypothetical protein